MSLRRVENVSCATKPLRITVRFAMRAFVSCNGSFDNTSLPSGIGRSRMSTRSSYGWKPHLGHRTESLSCVGFEHATPHAYHKADCVNEQRATS